jgi:hypothetical protein
MNKLLVALVAGAFAFESASVMAQAAANPKPATQPDTRNIPLKQMDVEQAKAAHAAAAEAWAKMTPEEQAAWKKKARAKRVADLNAMEEYAVEQGAVYDTEAAKKAAEQSKAMPKPSATERQKHLQEQTKAGG